MTAPHHRIVIVGTGFAGIGLAVRLRQAGIDDVVLLERADEVGGTWRDNTYPGATCDVPSLLYSFSFAPKPDWSSSFSPQEEIQAYLRDCAARFAIRERIRFRHELREACWEEGSQRWRLITSAGALTADVLVGGFGGLSEPSVPALSGLERFAGTTFHSARWEHGHDLRGKRVAVIGTGASAVQIVPAIQPVVARLDLYQRTPAWVIPRADRKLTRAEHALYRRFPLLQRLVRAGIYWGRESYVLFFTRHRPGRPSVPERLARRHLRRQVPDPALRDRLTPRFAAGCKRILISNDYYPALTRPGVEVVTSGIREVTEHGIVDEQGVHRPADTIIFATGFQVTEMPMAARVIGREGRSLAEAWQEGGAQAYLGTAVAGFPNFFLLTGPNTGLGHTSMVFMMESQFTYLVDCLRTMDRLGVRSVEVRGDVQHAYNLALQARMPGTVWNSGGCRSWYLDAQGRNTTLWPDYTWRFRLRTRRFDPSRYVLRRGSPVEAAPGAATG